MKNKLIDLNNHLFEALERLNDEDLEKEDLSKEIHRSKAIANVSKQIVSIAKLSLEARKHMDEFGYDKQEKQLPEIFIENKRTSNA